MLEVKISGLAQLDQALSTLAPRIVANIVRGGLRAGGKVIEAAAKEAAPQRTGKLAATIRTRSGIRRGVPQARVVVGSKEVWYAHLVEFGTQPHEIRPAGAKSLFLAGLLREVVAHPGAGARPFMRPAMDASQTAAALAAAEYMRKRLTKEGLETPEAFADDDGSADEGS